jgi:hypothetical protein
LCGPDLAPLPAAVAKAYGPLHGYVTLAEWIKVFGEMTSAKVALAERTLVARMGTTILDPAKANVIPLGHAAFVLKVGYDVVPLSTAGLACAHGFVAPDLGAMFGAEVAPAVLTNLDGRPLTPREPPADLAGCRSHMEPLKSVRRVHPS